MILKNPQKKMESNQVTCENEKQDRVPQGNPASNKHFQIEADVIANGCNNAIWSGYHKAGTVFLYSCRFDVGLTRDCFLEQGPGLNPKNIPLLTLLLAMLQWVTAGHTDLYFLSSKKLININEL